MHCNVFQIPRNHEYVRTLKRHLEKEGVNVVLLKPFHYSSFSNVLKMVYFRMRGYNVVHVHWLYIFPFRFMMKAFSFFCRSLGIRIVWEMHNILPHGYCEKDKENSQWFYEQADAIIFHSKDDIRRAKEMLGSAFEKPYIVIPHGNFNESYENTISKNQARKSLNIPDTYRVLLCFGFIRENRGYEYLLEAVKDMPKTTVLIAGKLEHKHVHEMLMEREKQMPQLRLFVKWIDNSEIQFYFNASDIVVLPYTEITTSGVIPLAYAFSRPVVTTGIGGIKDIVNEDTGILVPPRDAAALRKAVENLFNRDYEDMGKKARSFAEKEFSWTSNVQKIKRLYKSLGAETSCYETPAVTGERP